MIKKIVMILVFLVFILASFLETAEYNDVKHSEACENEEKIIEIQTISVEEVLDSKSIKGEKKSKKHYYLFHTKGVTKDEEVAIKGPKKMKKFKDKAELFAKSVSFYNDHPNYVSTVIDRGQKINWICRFPFTIFYGGRSILTTDKLGWAQPGKIISYLQGRKIKENWYQTPDAWIINNALDGAYKYFVSVYIPEADIVYVDDPETIVRRPK